MTVVHGDDERAGLGVATLGNDDLHAITAKRDTVINRSAGSGSCGRTRCCDRFSNRNPRKIRLR